MDPEKCIKSYYKKIQLKMQSWVLALTLEGGERVGCLLDTNKLLGLPWGGLPFPGAAVHVLVPWQRAAMTSSAALLCPCTSPKALQMEIICLGCSLDFLHVR